MWRRAAYVHLARRYRHRELADEKGHFCTGSHAAHRALPLIFSYYLISGKSLKPAAKR